MKTTDCVPIRPAAQSILFNPTGYQYLTTGFRD